MNYLKPLHKAKTIVLMYLTDALFTMQSKTN